MKKIFGSLVLGMLLFVSALPVKAHSGGDEHVGLESALPQLLEKYEVSSRDELDCDELADEDFEFIGDAVMEEMHPGEAHEIMDQRMGGEGSESLRLMHINMGQSYLRCDDYQGMGTGMMKGRMGMMNGNYNMMDNKYSEYRSGSDSVRNFTTYLLPLTLLSMFVFFTTGTYFFVKKLNKSKKK